jgi:hypothetical protein
VLAISLTQVELDAVVVGEVPCLIFGGGALTGETGAAKCLDVEVAMEAGGGIRCI